MSVFKLRLIRISFGAETNWITENITMKEWDMLMKCLKIIRKKKKRKKKSVKHKSGKLLGF